MGYSLSRPPNIYTHGVKLLWGAMRNPSRGPHVSLELVLTIFYVIKILIFWSNQWMVDSGQNLNNFIPTRFFWAKSAFQDYCPKNFALKIFSLRFFCNNFAHRKFLPKISRDLSHSQFMPKFSVKSKCSTLLVLPAI